MKKKVTQESIARALNLSRTTVFKALTNKPGVTDETRRQILNKAKELNYKGFQLYDSHENEESNKYMDILFLCPADSFKGSFWPSIIKGVEQVLKKSNARIRFSTITAKDEKKLFLSPGLLIPSPSGIILAGPFTSDFYKAVANLKKPMVSLDTTVDLYKSPVCDIVIMENYYASFFLTEYLIKKSHRHIAFVGDMTSCKSFELRYKGYCDAMQNNNIPLLYDNAFTFKNLHSQYDAENLYIQLVNMNNPPSAYVCANDSIALTMKHLRREPYKVDFEFEITGFDNAPEFAADTNFSTVDVHTEELGICLAEQILWRIENPKKLPRIITTSVNTILK